MTQAEEIAASAPELLHPRSPRNASQIANRLTQRDITTGDIAGLKRMTTETLTDGAFWKISVQLGLADCHPDLLRTWAGITKTIALSTKVGDQQTVGPHDGYMPLGKALFDTGYSEARLKSLLNADTDSIEPLLERMARFMHAKEQKFNWNDAARLALTKHRSPNERDADRTRIARDYYRQEYERTQQKSE